MLCIKSAGKYSIFALIKEQPPPPNKLPKKEGLTFTPIPSFQITFCKINFRSKAGK